MTYYLIAENETAARGMWNPWWVRRGGEVGDAAVRWLLKLPVAVPSVLQMIHTFPIPEPCCIVAKIYFWVLLLMGFIGDLLLS